MTLKAGGSDGSENRVLRVKPHAKGCACATCKLLRSVEQMPLGPGRGPGPLGNILGKK